MTADQFRKLALSLPGSAESPHFQYASFRANGRIFATLPPEGTHGHVFVGDPIRDQALAMHPEMLEKLWWGQRVAGLRVVLGGAQPAVVKWLLSVAYEQRCGRPARSKTAPRSPR